MIRLFSFLFLASVILTSVLADTQQCTDFKYTSFTGELPPGRSIGTFKTWDPSPFLLLLILFRLDEFCQCIKKSLVASKVLTGQSFQCGVNNAVTKLPWTTSPYKGDTGCTNCLIGCEDASSDPSKSCYFVRSLGGVTSAPVPKAARIRIIIIIVVTPRTITIYIAIVQ